MEWGERLGVLLFMALFTGHFFQKFRNTVELKWRESMPPGF